MAANDPIADFPNFRHTRPDRRQFLGARLLSQFKAKLLFRAALVVQTVGSIVLLASDFESPTSNYAFWTVIGAGFIEVALALRAKRKGEPILG